MLRWTKQAKRLTCLRDFLPSTLGATLQGLATQTQPAPSDWQERRGFGSSPTQCMEYVALNNLSDNPGATRTVRLTPLTPGLLLTVTRCTDGDISDIAVPARSKAGTPQPE